MAKLNRKLLRKVRDHILEEPQRYNQSTFGMRVNPELEDGPPCGTVACLAGWVVHLGDGESLFTPGGGTRRDIPERAHELLGTRELQMESEHVLFGTGTTWPRKFRDRLMKAKTARGRASAAAAYIDHIIETGGLD